MVKASEFLVWLQDVRLDDSYFLGNNLGVLGELRSQKIPVVDGFVITPHAFAHFLEHNQLETKIKHLIGASNPDRHDSRVQTVEHIQKLLLQSSFPHPFISQVFDAFETLRKHHKQLSFSSSVTGVGVTTEIGGEAHLMELVKAEWIRLFTPEKLFEKRDASPSLFVSQKFNTPETIKVFTVHPEKEKTHCLIEQDLKSRYVVEKVTGSVVSKELLPATQKKQLPLTDISKLLEISKKIEKILYFPQEISFTKVEKDFIVYACVPMSHPAVVNLYPSHATVLHGKVYLKGDSGYPGIQVGRVKVVVTNEDLKNVTSESIVVLKTMENSYKEKLGKVKAIIAEEGGDKSPTALFARTAHIPTILSVEGATKSLTTGELITAHAQKGVIYKGSIFNL